MMGFPLTFRHLSFRNVIFLFFSVLAISACSSKGFTLLTTKVVASIEADDKINPNQQGFASPTVIRIYELRSPKAFETGEFFDIYDSEQKSLKTTLIDQHEFTVKPGEKIEWTEYLHDDTTHLGVIAAFRNIDDAKWRATYELKTTATNRLTVSLKGLSVSISKN
jgi:type VI secretion system protein VasD